MKTAEEILSEVFFKSGDKFDGNTVNLTYEAMKMYAKQACKEQREICATTREEAEHANKGWRGVTVAILNAPEPELK